MGRRGRSPFAAIGERRAGSGPFDRDCERRALSAPRRRKPGSLRGGERSLLGVTARGETVCRPRGGVGRGGAIARGGNRFSHREREKTRRPPQCPPPPQPPPPIAEGTTRSPSPTQHAHPPSP